MIQASPMKLPPYVYRVPSRHGKTRIYFWRGRGHRKDSRPRDAGHGGVLRQDCRAGAAERGRHLQATTAGHAGRKHDAMAVAEGVRGQGLPEQDRCAHAVRHGADRRKDACRARHAGFQRQDRRHARPLFHPGDDGGATRPACRHARGREQPGEAGAGHVPPGHQEEDPRCHDRSDARR